MALFLRMAVVLAMLVLAALWCVPAHAQPEPMPGPIDPAFERWIERQDLRTFDDRTGWIPHPLPTVPRDPAAGFDRRAGIPVQVAPGVRASATDARFDWRDPDGDGSTSDSMLTPVRDQESCGACWAFAAYGALESYLKRTRGLSDSANDYSENNLKNNHGFDYSPCEGGNQYFAMAYLLRGDGPLRESDDPWSPTDNASDCPGCERATFVDTFVEMGGRSSAGDLAFIKQALVETGPVDSSMYHLDRYFDSATDTYYYDDSDTSSREANHGVVIVGWDDAKSVPGAPGAGAFIVRNSWGPSWGENGYFYVSYYDDALAYTHNSLWLDAPDSEIKVDRVYGYDDLGPVGTIGYGRETAWAAMAFEAETDGELVAVGVFLPAPGSATVELVRGSSPESAGSMLASESLSAEYKGYYSVALPTPVDVQAGADYLVRVQVASQGWGQPIGLDYAYPGFSSQSTAGPDETWISYDGGSWMDLYDYDPTASACIKAYVQETESDASPWSSRHDIYRFYNTQTGAHVYTINESERDLILQLYDYLTYEGVVFSALTTQETGSSPIYRFYNTDTQAHFYTADESERDLMISDYPSYTYEGVAFYGFTTEVEGGLPLYRFYNTDTGRHFYTASQAERDWVMAGYPEYSYQGIGFYVLE